MRVSFCSQGNFSKQGEVIKRLYKGGKDTVHLNEEGTKLLCGNIANVLRKQNGINPRIPKRYPKYFRFHYPKW